MTINNLQQIEKKSLLNRAVGFKIAPVKVKSHKANQEARKGEEISAAPATVPALPKATGFSPGTGAVDQGDYSGKSKDARIRDGNFVF